MSNCKFIEQDDSSYYHFSKKIIIENPEVFTFCKLNLSNNKLLVPTQLKYDPDYVKTIDNYDDVNNLTDDDIIFITNEICSNESDDLIYLEGTVGYIYDPKEVKLLYDKKYNMIMVLSDYRFLHEPVDYKLFNDSFNFTSGIRPKFNIESKKITFNLDIGTKTIEKNVDSVPYYRFPRSKDGISIQRLIYNIFKIYHGENNTKPYIVVPSEYYYYNINN